MTSTLAPVVSGSGNWPRPVLTLDVVQRRFWSYVEKSDGCWLWKGGKHPSGYGIFNLPKTEAASARKERAHRLVWTWERGLIPPSLNVCHRCDTPTCVRPDHLFLGSQSENIRDAINKGRLWEGSDHPLAKLTPDAVRDIRRRAAGGELHYRIAQSHGVNSGTIWHVVKGLTWKQVAAGENWW